MSDYLAARAAGESLTQRHFAEANAVNVRTFQWHLQRSGAEVARHLGLKVESIAAEGAQRNVRVQLTDRDVAILTRLGHDRVHDLPFLASLWFSSSQQPTKSAMTRLRLLERAGYVNVLSERVPLVTLTSKGARKVGGTARPMHPRHRSHHLATLRAIEAYRRDLQAIGGRLVENPIASGQRAEYLLEYHVQSQERVGTGTTAGTRYDTSPDAVVFAEVPDPISGELRTQCIALEYFTTAYSDAQIRSKASFLNTFDAVHQVADTEATARRVSAITGAPCLVQRRSP